MKRKHAIFEASILYQLGVYTTIYSMVYLFNRNTIQVFINRKSKSVRINCYGRSNRHFRSAST